MTADTDAVRVFLAQRVDELQTALDALAAERDALLREVIILRHALRAERCQGAGR